MTTNIRRCRIQNTLFFFLFLFLRLSKLLNHPLPLPLNHNLEHIGSCLSLMCKSSKNWDDKDLKHVVQLWRRGRGCRKRKLLHTLLLLLLLLLLLFLLLRSNHHYPPRHLLIFLSLEFIKLGIVFRGESVPQIEEGAGWGVADGSRWRGGDTISLICVTGCCCNYW